MGERSFEPTTPILFALTCVIEAPVSVYLEAVAHSGQHEDVLDRAQIGGELVPGRPGVVRTEQAPVGGAERGERSVVQRIEPVGVDVVVEPSGEAGRAPLERAAADVAPIHARSTTTRAVGGRDEDACLRRRPRHASTVPRDPRSASSTSRRGPRSSRVHRRTQPGRAPPRSRPGGRRRRCRSSGSRFGRGRRCGGCHRRARSRRRRRPTRRWIEWRAVRPRACTTPSGPRHRRTRRPARACCRRVGTIAPRMSPHGARRSWPGTSPHGLRAWPPGASPPRARARPRTDPRSPRARIRRGRRRSRTDRRIGGARRDRVRRSSGVRHGFRSASDASVDVLTVGGSRLPHPPPPPGSLAPLSRIG